MNETLIIYGSIIFVTSRVFSFLFNKLFKKELALSYYGSNKSASKLLKLRKKHEEKETKRLAKIKDKYTVNKVKPKVKEKTNERFRVVKTYQVATSVNLEETMKMPFIIKNNGKIKQKVLKKVKAVS